jgi:hypothetical protein
MILKSLLFAAAIFLANLASAQQLSWEEKLSDQYKVDFSSKANPAKNKATTDPQAALAQENQDLGQQISLHRNQAQKAALAAQALEEKKNKNAEEQALLRKYRSAEQYNLEQANKLSQRQAKIQKAQESNPSKN